VPHVIATGAVFVPLMSDASSQDLLKVSNAAQGAWESAVAELGQRAGIFEKHGISLDLSYTEDEAETLRRVISGKVDIGVNITASEVLRAYVRGRPVRIIGSNVTGGYNYWYVLATSPIAAIKDLLSRTIAYSTNGSSSHYDALDLNKEFGLGATLVATGGKAATFRELAASHIDVGWAAPPFGIDELERGRIRVVARANDVARIRAKTLSVLITNASTAGRRKGVLSRFLEAYRETVDWMYSGTDALGHYAKYAGVSEGFAQRLRDGFFSQDMLAPDKITGLKTIMREAGVRKLSRRQVREMIQIPPATRNGWSSWMRWLLRD
jgi:NitT/TauT family transport system substrate-binding protein